MINTDYIFLVLIIVTTLGYVIFNSETSAGSMTMALSFLSSLNACNLSFVKLQSVSEADCRVDKGRVTVVMDKKDYTNKMDSLVNDKQTYKPLKRNHTSALQQRQTT